MPQLLTIDDLLANPPEENARLIGKARELGNVYEAYMAADGGDSHLRAPGIHASEVSGCERKIVYSLTATPRKEQTAAIWKKRFKMGHAIHAMLQEDFRKMARSMNLKTTPNWHISFEEEMPIAPQYQPLARRWDIHSHFDGLFVIRESWDGPAVLRVLLEIKSEAPASYEKLRNPKLDHIEQAHVYMACFNTPLIWFLYYNKGNQNYTGPDERFLVRFDPKIWADLEKRFERAHEYAGNGVLPDRTESVKCDFCAFSWTCQPSCLGKSQNYGAPRKPWLPLRGP